jgi:hypothetical protein
MLNNKNSLKNQLINTQLANNGRVTLSTANACLTIEICPTTRKYIVEGKIETDRDIGTAWKQNAQEALQYVQEDLKIQFENVITII